MKLFTSFLTAFALTAGILLLFMIINLASKPSSMVDEILNNYAASRGITGYNASAYDLNQDLKYAWALLDAALIVAYIAALVAVFAYAHQR